MECGTTQVVCEGGEKRKPSRLMRVAATRGALQVQPKRPKRPARGQCGISVVGHRMVAANECCWSTPGAVPGGDAWRLDGV